MFVYLNVLKADGLVVVACFHIAPCTLMGDYNLEYQNLLFEVMENASFQPEVLSTSTQPQ